MSSLLSMTRCLRPPLHYKPNIKSWHKATQLQSLVLKTTSCQARKFHAAFPWAQSATAEAHDIAPQRSLAEMLSLKGKTTVVTGGARGIGLALAGVSAELGSDIAVIDTLDKPHQDYDKLSQHGVKVKYYRSDVTKEEALTSTFDEIVADFGQIDTCVTAAGIVCEKPFLEHGWQESSKVLNVNVLGTFFSAQLASKQMVKQGNGGSIMMIASVASHCSIPAQNLAIYAASKGAVRILCRHLAAELAEHNIRVNTISPGYIATDMTLSLERQFPELLEVFRKASPMKRMAVPRELAGAVAYLLSDAASYTTGADIRIDGALAAGQV